MMRSSRSKYGSQKVTVGGVTFDSQREYRRFCELSLLERAGKITNLQRQVKYVLIPSQKDEKGKVIERECSYIADFVYVENGKLVVEDAKGYKTPEYRIKKKMALYFHGIRIKEV